MRFCHPAVPNAVLELPKRSFLSSFFRTLIFGRFGSLFLRSGLILETSASQKPVFSLGKTMIYTFAPFPLPARFFHRKCPKRCKKEPKNKVISISIFRVPLFVRPRGSRETTQKPPRSALRGPRAAREASRAAFGGLRASFGSLRGLFPMILVYFCWPQPVDSATNRTVPICPQSRVSRGRR